VDGTGASVQVSQALLRQAAAGPTANERELARLRVAQAKADLYGLQGRRDALGGLRGGSAYEVGSFEAAEGQVFAAETGVDIAQVQERITISGARAEDVAVARARVAEAEIALEAARAQCERAQQSVLSAQQRVRLSEADLAVAQLGAPAEELAVADAQLRQAEAAVESVRVGLSRAELRAPFAGSVAQLDLRVGEWLSPGEARIFLGDLSDLYIETTDLDEIDVARVAPGVAARLTFDALPGVELPGIVERIALKTGAALGGTAYPVIIAPLEDHQGLRWGMTAFIDIEAQ
jgi:HlyD family secretion protein